jgi:hypothetical protein
MRHSLYEAEHDDVRTGTRCPRSGGMRVRSIDGGTDEVVEEIIGRSPGL